ncbi:MAG: kelch repeat-containing protein [Acidobacteriaceae bacterium]
MEGRWKSCVCMLAGMALLGFTGCGGSSSMSSSPTPPTVHNEWTWISGSNAINQLGVYGTKGTANIGNTPGARTSPSSWTDVSGNLWLFGGYGAASAGIQGDLNDLWKYSGGEWTWVSGSSTIEAKGTYGTQGVASPNNVPGARYEAESWIDPSGNLWLFGGLGIDSTGTRGYLNDLWKYNPASNTWTWMNGSNTASQEGGFIQPGVYGTQGVAAPGNMPGARVDAMSWADASGNLWLFGGEGYDSTNGVGGILNDLWKYSAGEWTWMSGSNTAGPFRAGTYGTQGTPAPDNVPGPRTNAVTWTDAEGNLWLFGGQGNDSTGGAICSAYGGPCLLNDLWKYSNGEWTWMGGSNLSNEPGTYGTKGTATPGNIPGARWMAVSWIDAAGDVWLFGGQGFDSTPSPGVFGDLNDLWKFSGGEWTWMGGPNLGSATPLAIYGTQGTPSASNVPGQRESAVGWIDSSGNLWLFGGDDDFSVAFGGKFNDLWEYQP